jgi:putative phosphoribosyl transferase
MYFDSRADAGRQLADRLMGYANQNTAVVALNEGGVIVGAQIAIALHANLMLLASTNITLPGESEPIAGMTGTTTYTDNPRFSEGELEELEGEYHGYIEEQRIEKIHELNTIIGKAGEVKRDLLKRHVVILVADGLPDGFLLDMAADFLKPVKMKKLVVAVPIASIPAVDRMHLVADELHVLSVLENYLKTDHYYEDNSIPDQEGLFKVMKNISLEWKQSKN